ncbi:type II toxin-antitoxin system VapC family toxin [Candidatus Electronema sp. PJ]|uniref:type II toxin-antitoxin system VapC family toxin n=1 Tax=Candidatus Electronema sp. PJ TaxID=3401572 RepID=UPI003AA87FBF
MVSAHFLDTSALVKKYMTEKGSAWIEALTDPDSDRQIIILASVTWVETLSAFSRLHRENRVDPELLAQTVRLFKTEWASLYHIVDVEQSDIKTAGRLVQRHPLRAYDSIQLACALKIYSAFSQTAPDAFSFVSADKQLLAAAQTEGLLVENPNNHP